MDSNYIINRLKSTLYKYPTVQLLKMRMGNLDDFSRSEVVRNLKTEFYKHCNTDIQEPLSELLQRSR
ncbi:hypothetical protein FNO01nite_26080 [Flavobacterium noncentrifugens]|uniref:Uncharacterized protein n=1 Tax=Flavobacterium noncentrifugens TaxID=1128970 RepID=A0A1G8ZIF9_9FLAO|nr:hypothetical protein [Flavobacterium noncentrifugens]GEP51936.1 hypothetical protein FNO01nite_26080 [Flavobacterium noncentrifugens]SDK14374.1 hypothetical protein SAMN04487935_2591 [Flavobacterium noncentrifugens]